MPDGFTVTARIDDYESEPVEVRNGRYAALTVGPPDRTYSQKVITFHLDGVEANEKDKFVAAGTPTIKKNFSLTFQALPTPTPTVTPVPTRTSTPTMTPTRPPTSTITLTPVVALPSVYFGSIIIAGATVPEGAVLVAKIGDYESHPALIDGDLYRNLVIDPQDSYLVGMTIEFFLNNVMSRTSDTYKSNSVKRNFDLVFIDVPTSTPTPLPPTVTPTPAPPTPTETPVTPSPTATATPTTQAVQFPPTATATPTTRAVQFPPTATATPTTRALQFPPTATATATRTPLATKTPTVLRRPTSTPRPTLTATTTVTPAATSIVVVLEQTPTPVPSGGSCSSTFGRSSPLAGLGNVLFLLAPLAMISGYRRWRRWRRWIGPV